jgi:DNA-binding FadR family transcriptional regulator
MVPTLTRAKSAELVAAKIEADIIKRRLGVGHVIGSETDLLKRYAVSRAVFREAVRILEHQSVARMRKGPGGGLAVELPIPLSVSRAMAIYLRYAEVTPRQLIDIRLGLESTVLDLATRNLNRDGESAIRGYLEGETTRLRTGIRHSHEFHLLLAQLTRNTAMELFVQCLLALTEARGDDANVKIEAWRPDVVHAQHSMIAEAVIERHVEAAKRLMADHIRGLARYLIAAS